MSHKLTVEDLKLEYNRLENEGRKWLKEAQTDPDYTLSALATIRLNAVIVMKETVLKRIGQITVNKS